MGYLLAASPRRMDFPHSTGLSDAFRVIAFDYVGHIMRIPKPQTLAPAHIIAAVLAVADVAQTDRFAYFG